LKADSEGFTFRFSEREKNLLLSVLHLYPVLPDSYPRISRSTESETMAEAQLLLDESLAEQRRASRRKLESLFNDSRHFQSAADGVRFSVATAQLEWLLQVLNEIRVGSWVRLGSPDLSGGDAPALDNEAAVHLVALQSCGYFETAFLRALDGDDPLDDL
jgi:hypothetical protein